MNTISKAVSVTLLATFGFTASAYAGCNSVQVSGVWEAAFSDGNSCRIKIKTNGSVDADNSVCYDPNRGTGTVNGGNLKPKADCFSEGELVVGGDTIELPVQFSHDRSMAAGRYRFADGTKGSVVMVRVN